MVYGGAHSIDRVGTTVASNPKKAQVILDFFLFSSDRFCMFIHIPNSPLKNIFIKV